jgi:uncharacterized protein (TIGR02118 family)
MFKGISIVHRLPGTTKEEFEAFWTGTFAPLAARLPRLRRYVVNVVREGPDTFPDGFAEIWFDSKEDYEAAFAESELNDALHEAHGKFLAGFEMYIVDEIDVPIAVTT